jgi:hypothetical protein
MTFQITVSTTVEIEHVEFGVAQGGRSAYTEVSRGQASQNSRVPGVAAEGMASNQDELSIALTASYDGRDKQHGEAPAETGGVVAIDALARLRQDQPVNQPLSPPPPREGDNEVAERTQVDRTTAEKTTAVGDEETEASGDELLDEVALDHATRYERQLPEIKPLEYSVDDLLDKIASAAMRIRRGDVTEELLKNKTTEILAHVGRLGRLIPQEVRAARTQLNRKVIELFAGGPDTSIRTTWHDGVAYAEVPMDELSAVLSTVLGEETVFSGGPPDEQAEPDLGSHGLQAARPLSMSQQMAKDMQTNLAAEVWQQAQSLLSLIDEITDKPLLRQNLLTRIGSLYERLTIIIRNYRPEVLTAPVRPERNLQTKITDDLLVYGVAYEYRVGHQSVALNPEWVIVHHPPQAATRSATRTREDDDD